MTTISQSARKTAEVASFQAFANCYLREVDAGTWHSAKSWELASGVLLSHGVSHVVELELESQAQVVAIAVCFRSMVGRHTMSACYRRRHSHGGWERLDGLSAHLLLIDSLYAQQPESEQRLELIARVVESHQVMARYVQRRLAGPPKCADQGQRSNKFIESESSVVLGHWLHPTPKSRQGILDWQHEHYAPELAGRFQLHFFAVDRRLVQQASLLPSSAEQISRRMAEQGSDRAGTRRLAALPDHYCLLPLHPLQAQWLLHQDHVRALLADDRLVDLGRLGPEFSATSSVRTLYSERADCMVKLSIPVKITNALRINLQSELGDSIWISQLLRTCGISEAFPQLHVIEDPAYITVVLPDREETGFETIFRSNPFRESDSVHSIAALVQDPLSTSQPSHLEQLVRCFADSQQLPLTEASRRWFDAYWACAMEAPLRIYDHHGIALEAHQQNVLLGFDTSGLPRCCYYRDIQGVGLSECHRDELLIRVPELARQTKVFEPDDIVRNGFGYYLFFNQLYAVINRFALDGLLDEATLLGVVRRKLSELRPQLRKLGVEFIDMHLKASSVPCKGNLLTRVADMDELQAENELAVYRSTDNPLHVRCAEIVSATAATRSWHVSVPVATAKEDVSAFTHSVVRAPESP